MRIINNVMKTLDYNSPSILVGIGIVGVVCTVVTACKATPKAMDILEKKKEEKRKAGEDPELKPAEKVKAVAKTYAPAVIIGGCSIVCFLQSNNIALKRNAALASLYTVAQNTIQTHQEKLVEAVGEKKATEINDEVAKEQRKEVQIPSKYVDMEGPLFFDIMSKRYFTCPNGVEEIWKAQNDFNYDLRTEIEMTANDFNGRYLPLHEEMKYAGDAVGWDINGNGYVDLRITWDKINGMTVGTISHNNPPLPKNSRK